MPSPAPRLLSLAAAPALAALAVAAVPAGAATITVPPCVADVGVVRTLPVTGTGFTPGQSVRLNYLHPLFGSRVAGGVLADAAGNFTYAAFPAPFANFSTQEQSFGLQAIDGANPALTATANFRQVRFGATVFPNRGRASTKVRYTVRGFLPGRNVYAHFRFAGKTRRNLKIGNPAAPCGIVARRSRLIPARARAGVWNVYFDQRKTYRKSTRPQVRASIFVTRRLR
jgi:hypothetical protein